MPDPLRAVMRADLPVRKVAAGWPAQAAELCRFIARLLAPDALVDTGAGAGG